MANNGMGPVERAPRLKDWFRGTAKIEPAKNPAFDRKRKRSRDRLALGLATALLLLAACSTFGQLLVQNGDFEAGNFAGWTQSGDTHSTAVTTNMPYVHSGMYGAELGPDGPAGFLSQTLSTTPGQTYQLSLWLYCDDLSFNFFQVSWNGTVIFDQTNLPALGWTNLQFTVAATNTNTILQFQFLDASSYLGLDDVSVTPPPPPENDQCSGAIDISSGDVYVMNTAGATSVNDPVPLCSGLSNGVWFKVTIPFLYPPQIASITVDTSGTDYPVDYAVYYGPCGSLYLNGCGPQGGDALGGGGPFYILVGGIGGATGNLHIKTTYCIKPELDSIDVSQSPEFDGIHIRFHANTLGNAINFTWSFTSPETITNYGQGTPDLTLVVSPTSEDFIRVGLVVSGCNGSDQGGSSAAPCDFCLSRGSPNVLAGSTGSGAGPVEPTSCGSVSVYAQWYRMIPSSTGPVTVSTEGSAIPTLLAVFNGPLTAPTAIACNSGIASTNKISLLTFNATNGIVYWIVVDPKTNNVSSSLRVASGFQPSIASYGLTNGGAFALQSTIAPAITYQLLATTNPAISLSNWPIVLSTNLSTNSPYLYYRETNMQAYPQRFYFLKPKQ